MTIPRDHCEVCGGDRLKRFLRFGKCYQCRRRESEIKRKNLRRQRAVEKRKITLQKKERLEREQRDFRRGELLTDEAREFNTLITGFSGKEWNEVW